MVTSRYEPVQLRIENESLPLSQQEAAVIEVPAKYLLSQGIKAHIDELGYPVLEGEDIHGILMTADEKLQLVLAETILRIQKVMK